MELLGLIGASANQSYNRWLLLDMLHRFGDMTLQELDLPLFCEEQPTSSEVQDLRAHVAQADGLVIATAEYDHAVPAILKNALEWLSVEPHVLAGKSVMIVGASLGLQGTVRAQMNLRVILDSPGIDARVMPGREFTLAKCASAFDDQHRLSDAGTVAYLTKCHQAFTEFVQAPTAALAVS